MAFLDLRKNSGSEHHRARDLFTALWVSDLFMERVAEGGSWSLFCPHECPGLSDVYGDEYRRLYARYEASGRARQVLPAQAVWSATVTSQIETGTPYLLCKDAINRKSNQSNLGVIKSSNLCVGPDTPILTRLGQLRIGDLAGRAVEVWNGAEFSSVTIVKTGVHQPMVRLTFSNGLELTCTPYHKFYLAAEGGGGGSGEEGDEVRACQLEIGAALATCSFPVIGERVAIDGADECGGGGGTLEERVAWVSHHIGEVGGGAWNDPAQARRVILILQTMGVSPRWSAATEQDSARERLHISRRDAGRLLDLGCAGAELQRLASGAGPILPPPPITLVSKEPAPHSDTFCFEEPLRHRGIFGGMYTGQCAEICEYTAPDEIAVCNLASINLAAFVRDGGASYDFQALADTASTVTHNLDLVIDRNFYAVPEAKYSNRRHRPIGLGSQGLQDSFFQMRLPFDSPQALKLSTDIAEAIYYGAVRASVAMAREAGPYSSFAGSPASEGKLQFHMWDVIPSSDNFDWEPLVADVKTFGLRNSLLTAQMPTASTSAIMGKTESVEALASNVYCRRTNSGEHVLLNEYLVDDLIKLGKFTPELMNQLIADEGSVQQLDIPEELKALYKTTWELSQRSVIDQAVARGPFIDQSQSMNLFLARPTVANVSSALFYGWRHGLKTCMYYLRSRPAANPIQFSVDQQAANKSRAEAAAKRMADEAPACTRAMRNAGCESCSG